MVDNIGVKQQLEKKPLNGQALMVYSFFLKVGGTQAYSMYNVVYIMYSLANLILTVYTRNLSLTDRQWFSVVCTPLKNTMFAITMFKMLWNHEAQLSESTTYKTILLVQHCLYSY